MSATFHKPIPYAPNLPYDWETGGRMLSEEELQIARLIAIADYLNEEKKHERTGEAASALTRADA